MAPKKKAIIPKKQVRARREFTKATKAKIAKLDVKQRRYIQGRFRGLGKSDAAREADYTEFMSRNVYSKIETADVKDAMQAMLDEIVPLNLALFRLRQGMSATKTEFAKFEGSITDALDVVDHGKRIEASKHVTDLHKVTDGDGDGSDRIIVKIDTGNSKSVAVKIEKAE